MARYSTVALAFALGASAAPHWPGWGGNHGSSQGGPSGYGVSPAGPSGGASKGFPSFPVPSAPVPTGSAGGAGPSGGSPRPPPFSYSQIANATAPVYVGAATASSASFSVSYFPTASASGNSSAPAPTSAPKVLSTGGGAVSGGDLPVASGTTTFNAVQTIAAGGSFDGGMAQFGRGVTCTGQVEGGTSDAVFMIEDGGSLSNVIIGPDQIEGVHCYGSCTLTNVWWAAVCEDAFSIKEQADGATTTISGGGAFGATDKVFQHNGGGTLSVSGFTVDTFGKLYRSCGSNCETMPQRNVIMNDITASSGSVIAGVNSNYGDTATLTNIKVSAVEDICVTYTGNNSGAEPVENGSGPSASCIYSQSDITQF